MKKTAIEPQPSFFEHLRKTDSTGIEYWFAEDLARALGYPNYKEFQPAIQRAKQACQNSGQAVEDHFKDAIEIGGLENGKRRKPGKVKLSRYACYLSVLNADPSKEAVALGQTYFALQARLQELHQGEEYQRLATEEKKRLYLRRQMAKLNIRLSSAAKKAGVAKPEDYAIFQNHGYMGLYGGLDANDIRSRKGLEKSQNILDHMGSTELAANLARAIETDEKLKNEHIQGMINASQAHFEAGQQVRRSFQQLEGMVPEDLPVQDDIKHLDKKKKKK